MAQQLELSLKTWGGRRKGAGRKPKGEKAGVVHLRRPRVSRHSPVHVTLRRGKYPAAVVTALSAGKKGVGFRLVHDSIQSNHLHLIVEAADNKALARGMKALNVRVARAVNRLLEGRARVRPFRRPALSRLAPPYFCRPVLLCVPGSRTRQALFPPEPKAESLRSGRARGLSDTYVDENSRGEHSGARHAASEAFAGAQAPGSGRHTPSRSTRTPSPSFSAGSRSLGAELRV